MVSDNSQADQIRAALRTFAYRDIDAELIRTNDLGKPLDFSDHRDIFEDIQRFTLGISELQWELLPLDLQRDVISWLADLERCVERIRAFTSTSSRRTSPEVDRDKLARDLGSQFNVFIASISPLLGYISWSSLDVEGYRQSFHTAAERAQQETQRLSKEIEAVQTGADEALGAIREAAAEQGVSQEAAVFQKAARRYAITSYVWLGASLLFAGATVGVAFLLLWRWSIDGNISEAHVLQMVLARATALAVLSFLSVTAIRMFRSNSHLEVVNRHREDALRTFRAFVEGTDAEDTRSQVLLLAAHAAFAHTPTGLISDKAEGNTTVEVLDRLGSNLARDS